MTVKIFEEKTNKKISAALALVAAFSQVLKNALNLLGIQVLEKM